MKNFKVELSKDSKKYTFVLKANYEIELKEKFHKEGYNILSIIEVDNIDVSGKAFYFEILINGEIKKGTINSTDIFKSYLKLRKELGYTVRYLYDKLDITEEEKVELIHKLEKQYELFNINNSTVKKEEVIIKKQENNNNDKKQENFYLKKELDEAYNIINFVLIKLKNIIDGKIDETITNEEKDKLNNIYNNLIKVKSSTNIAKLKEIGELALKKIGEIELSALENKKTKENSLILQETNKLLKKVGSKTQFIEKEKDIGYILGNLGNTINEFFINNFKQKKVKKEKIDKESYYFLKNETLLRRYKNLEKELNNEKLKNIIKFIFQFNIENKNFVIKYNIKQALIKQNINLLEAKLSTKSFSYTKIVNTYQKGLGKVLYIFNILKNSIFYFIFLYSLFFIIFIILSYYINLDYNLNLDTLRYIILLLFFYFYFAFSKNFKLILINLLFFGFLIIIYLINF